MDHIREALLKANASLDDRTVTPPASDAPARAVQQNQASPARPTIRSVQLDPRQMERARIVSYKMSDERHVAFNLLRTRVRAVMDENKWKSIAITSPTPRCGKTTVALNLAFSLARSPECKVVLIDLDLKKPAIARTLGIDVTGSIGSYLRGQANAADCFVQLVPNLVVGLNKDRIQESSELIQAARMSELLRFVHSAFAPDIVVFDLPPMLPSDDALAFLPKVDCALLVVTSRTTKAAEAIECESQISARGKLLGVTLNKGDAFQEEYY